MGFLDIEKDIAEDIVSSVDSRISNIGRVNLLAADFHLFDNSKCGASLIDDVAALVGDSYILEDFVSVFPRVGTIASDRSTVVQHHLANDRCGHALESIVEKVGGEYQLPAINPIQGI
jgi:hypothetical protein